MNTYEWPITLAPLADGGYTALCRALDCKAEGATLEEALANLRALIAQKATELATTDSEHDLVPWWRV
ncbi:MAG: hypothetical protein HY686_08360 [Chloroflexi bacterium]|nr:hypothetical protein [Chloroflexota bacterium]